MKPAHLSATFALLEQAAQAFGQAYFVYHTAEKRFTYLNPAFAQLWGLAPGTLQHKAGLLQPTLHPEDLEFVRAHYHNLLKGKDQKKLEFRIVRPNGEVRWLCLACLALTENGSTQLAGYAEDFTERREYTYNILKYNTKKNSTLEILSHDLAAPFTNIRGLIGLVEMQQPQLSDEVKRMMGFIKEDAQRGSDLIRDFVNNEFLESSQVELHKDRVDIVHRIEVMIDNYQQSEALIAKQFVLKAPQKPIYIYVDEMKFMQALNNLISNAIKFTEDNGIITLTVEGRENTTYLSVADNGIGIPDEMKPILFDKFTKARREGVRGEKSVGMGMSIIRNILELHKGRIWFDSTEGKGSVFHIELPNE